MTHEEFLKNYLILEGPGKSKVLYNGKWVYSQHLSRIYGISCEQYYESLVERPKCSNPRCQNKCLFRKLSDGFSKHCSTYCSTQHRSNNMWNNPDSKMHSAVRDKTKNKGRYNLIGRFKNYEGCGWFYVVEINPKVIKIGATTQRQRIEKYGVPIRFVSKFERAYDAFLEETRLLKLTNPYWKEVFPGVLDVGNSEMRESKALNILRNELKSHEEIEFQDI